MKRKLLGILLGLLLLMPAGAQAQAASFKNKGLLITPVRAYLDVAAGQSKTSSFVVVNSTDKPMDVMFSVQAFSVDNYTYDYIFKPPKENWVKTELQQTRLQPAKSKTVKYTVSAPQDAPSGGHYYTIFASTTYEVDGVKSQVQTAIPLYITVSGELERSAVLQNTHNKRFIIGKEIPFSLELKNTGNVHYFANVQAQLGNTKSSVSHLLLPDTSRNISGTLPSPKLPGVYRVSYGFGIENGQSQTRKVWVVYLPVWGMVVLVFIAWGIILLVRHILYKKRRKRGAKLHQADKEKDY